ncbi:MFS transporter, partial [Francisella tularensis subsp. holarctica]|nr:MFS transporter [Francisella tularensis subsp. holarctica]
MNIGFVGIFNLAGVILSYGAFTIAFYTAAGCLALTVILHLLNFKNVEDKDTFIHNQFSKSKARFVVAPGIILVW